MTDGPAPGADGAARGDGGTGGDGDGGAQAPSASGIDLARQALAQARAAARERGATPGPRPQKRRRGRVRSRRDPQPFGEAVRAWLTERGYAEQLAVGGVFGRWSDIVGEFNAQHLRPVSYEAGELVVAAESATMAAHARAMARDLIRRLNEELGQGTVHSIKVTGPGRGRGAGRLRVR